MSKTGHRLRATCTVLTLDATRDTVEVLFIGGGCKKDDSYPTNAELIIYSKSGGSISGTSATIGTNSENPRRDGNGVLLPDGKVLAIGGEGPPSFQNRSCEIYDPESHSFAWADSLDRNRGHHSIAMLLPDGRVFAAGHENSGQFVDRSYQVFYPPYLFDGNSWADRASIVDYPHPSSDTIVYGLPFQIGMTDSAEAAGVDEIALMRPSAATHASDFSQCRVRLSHAVLPDDPDRLVVAGPKDSTYAPAGYYLLFALSDGVPSEGKWVKVGATGTYAVADGDSTVWGGDVWLDRDFEVQGGGNLTILPGTTVWVEPTDRDNVTGGDEDHVEIVVRDGAKLVAASSDAELPIVFQGVESGAGNWFGIRLETFASAQTGYGFLACSGDSGDFNSGCGDERSGFENVVISDSEFGISIEGNVAPELSNVAFQDITDDRDIYLATGDVVVPVDFEWNLIAPTHVVASSTSTVVDYDYGVEDKFDLIVEGLLNTNRDDPGDSTWVFFEPEDPSDATATEWGGVFLNWSSSGSVVKYADFSYAENPLYLDWPGWNGSTVSATYIRNCRVHHFADVGIWVHGSLGNSAGGAVVESSLVERGSTLIPALGRVGVYLDGADLGGLSDNTIRIESNSLGDPAADYSHAVEAYFGKPMCLAAGPYWARTLSFLGNTLEGPDHDADATVGGTSGFFGNYLCGGNNRTIEVKENWIHGFNFSGLDFNRSSDVQVECNVVDDNARAIEFTRDIATTGVGVRFKENYFGVPADHESLVQTDMAAKTKLGAAITSTKGLNEFRTYGTEGNDLTRFILENEPGDTDSLDARKNQWWKNDTLFTNVDSVYVEALIWTTLPTDTIPENEPAVRLDPLVEQIQDPCWEDVAGRQARRPGLVGGSRVVDAGGTKGVEDLAESVPLVTRISAPYPNPAHGSSRVALEISPDRAGRYRIEVFDVAGRSVAVLMDRDVSAGRYQVEWPGRVHGGRTAGPGVYFVRVTGPGVHRNAKLVVLR